LFYALDIDVHFVYPAVISSKR